VTSIRQKMTILFSLALFSFACDKASNDQYKPETNGHNTKFDGRTSGGTAVLIPSQKMKDYMKEEMGLDPSAVENYLGFVVGGMANSNFPVAFEMDAKFMAAHWQDSETGKPIDTARVYLDYYHNDSWKRFRRCPDTRCRDQGRSKHRPGRNQGQARALGHRPGSRRKWFGCPGCNRCCGDAPGR